jgi:two-component system sensor histidine kinase VicK
VVLRISDSGIGVPSDEQARAFERFFRGREALTRNIPGNGLGLAVTKAVVRIHNGAVWMDSEPGRGTTVYLTLPKDVKVALG